jgi:hypothetical protein
MSQTHSVPALRLCATSVHISFFETQPLLFFRSVSAFKALRCKIFCEQIHVGRLEIS